MSFNNTENYMEQGGSTWKIGGALEITGAFTVESGGTLTVENGGDLNVDSGGKITVDSGGQILFAQGAKLSHIINALSSAQSLTLPGVYRVTGTSTWVNNAITLPAPTTNGESFEFYSNVPTSTANCTFASTGPTYVNLLNGAAVKLNLFGGGYAKFQALGSTAWGVCVAAASSGAFSCT